MSTIGVFGCRVPGHADLFKKWDKLAHFIVRKNLWRLRFWFDYDELMNHARQGLWRAHETYDPNNGANFQTYARRVMTNAFNALHHYSQANMRRDRYKSVSVDDDAGDLHLSSDSIPADVKMMADEEAVLVRTALSELKPRDKRVIMDRLIKEKTLEVVGAELGLTRERVRQIEKAALVRISFSLERSFPLRRVSKPSLKIRTGRLSRT
jgi:RNA polymerase sigma factor (sigma-70 family)